MNSIKKANRLGKIVLPIFLFLFACPHEHLFSGDDVSTDLVLGTTAGTVIGVTGVCLIQALNDLQKHFTKKNILWPQYKKSEPGSLERFSKKYLMPGALGAGLSIAVPALLIPNPFPGSQISFILGGLGNPSGRAALLSCIATGTISSILMNIAIENMKTFNEKKDCRENNQEKIKPLPSLN